MKFCDRCWSGTHDARECHLLRASLTGLLLSFLLIFVVSGCPKPIPTPVPPSPNDGSVVLVTCAGICEMGDRMQCSWAMPIKNLTCLDVCRNAERGPTPWPLDCMAEATTCDAADRCQPASAP